MMGSGKSTIGAMAAHRLGLEFFDTDEMVVQRVGKTIPRIWEEMGEQGFRELEREAVSSVPGSCIAAAGGGAVLDPGNRAAIVASPPVVWLRARPETLALRAGPDGNRPLLRSAVETGDRMRQILSERVGFYEAVATHTVETDDRDVVDVTDEVVAIWPG